MINFKIELPEPEIDEKSIEKRNRAFFTEDFEKGGILAKTLIFTMLNQPASTTEITKKINDYYKTDIDRASIYRALQKLNEKNITSRTTTGIIFSLSESERSEIHKKIMEKYYSFLHTIPEQFKKRFQDLNYFWVSNGIGTKYIEWCCKILGFKCNVEK